MFRKVFRAVRYPENSLRSGLSEPLVSTGILRTSLFNLGGLHSSKHFTNFSGIKGVHHIVVVASGKGGVGKSTTAVNLAVSLAASEGLRVGLLDADVFGPSIPRLLNLSGKPLITEEKQFLPLENYGVRCMSMGFLMKADDAAVWRGPMVMGAITKLLQGVEWAPLDVLVVDMPPGTGDAHLSMSQKVNVSGAVIVSTPQDLALMDARRGIAMYNKVNVPVLGLVENMSYHICKSCSHREHIFGHGGAKTAAGELGVDFLGEIPLEMTIQESADLGKPISLSLPESQSAIQYKSIAAQVVAKLRLIESEQDGPPKLKVTNKLQKKANMAPADLLAMIEKYISQHISIPEWNMLHVILTALSVIQVITSYGGEASGKANMGYSKFANPKAKSTVPSKFGMFIIYVGAMLVNLVCLSGMLFSDHEIHNSRQVLVAICLSVHFVKRELEVLFLHRFSGVTELPVALMISVFYTLGSVQIEYFVSTVSESYYGANPSSLPVGVVLFVTGTLGNLYHHSLLAGLRKPNEKKYVKPEGGLFSLVTCPHYFFELMAWYGISILSLQLNVFLNGFAMTSYLLGRSVATSRWYREKMEDYPQKMKCIIPFVF
ncbi:hypothetical protein CYMTET_16646 [Cymbomonas tetramitiformis]|uniref:Nucleotide-binding protein-like n=1 Tax=Cymbomonas tetramitiformis TaxID=36881 RepID=A0AAE0GC61_9CHLO|nr:hypothetical protein CYMTET_16646 [Cymbomonas tetramitiformis]